MCQALLDSDFHIVNSRKPHVGQLPNVPKHCSTVASTEEQLKLFKNETGKYCLSVASMLSPEMFHSFLVQLSPCVQPKLSHTIIHILLRNTMSHYTRALARDCRAIGRLRPMHSALRRSEVGSKFALFNVNPHQTCPENA